MKARTLIPKCLLSIVSAVAAAGSSAAKVDLLGLPLSFEPNYGQGDPSVKFVAHNLSDSGYTLALTEDGAILSAGSAALRMRMVQARKAEISRAELLPGTLPAVSVGGTQVQVIGVALSTGSVGLYQVAIQLHRG